MAHRCEFEDRIEIYNDYETEQRCLVRMVRATYKTMSLDVYKEYEECSCYGMDNTFARNLMYCNMGGYLVTFPGEKAARYYWGAYNGYDRDRVQGLDDWENISKCNLWCSNILDYESEANIIALYPNFKYVLKKMPDSDKNVERVWDLLKIWKEHPEIEGLCQLGFYKIALNKSLFKLSLPKRKQIIQWIMKNQKLVEYPAYMKLVHIQKMIKYNLTVDQFIDYDRNTPSVRKYKNYKYHTWTADVPTFFYLKKQGYKDYSTLNIASLYHDYIEMASSVGHDMKDKYWKYPSDLNKAHAKVMQELANVRKTATALQGDYLKAVMEPLAKKFNAKINGYDIFLPTDINTIQKQCDVLYQCLMRNNYVNEVLLQTQVLVFIWKDGVPQATAQVYYNKSLGQFYGDERGHSRGEDCLPSQEVQEAFNKWLDTFEPFKVKAKRDKVKKHYYKGFQSVDAKGVYHTPFGNYSFEVGKTYATDFGDNEILVKGEGCYATNMVFHFCEDIKEIQNHYSPTCYAEIEPLGPVVENNGAFLSNRIKIIRPIVGKELELLLA